MKDYLKKYLNFYNGKGKFPAYSDEDFENIDTLLNVLPGKLQEFDTEEINNSPELPDFIKTLSDSELKDFVEDILFENERCIGIIFKSSKFATPEQHAFDSLANFPYAILEKIEKCFETIFQRIYLSDNQADKDALKKIMDITALKKIGLGSAFLKRKLRDPQINEQFKLKLLTLLSNIDKKYQEPLDEFWKSIDVVKEPWLASGVMAEYKLHRPAEALITFAKIPADYEFQDKKVRNSLMRNLETTLTRLRSIHGEAAAVDTFKRILPAIGAAPELLNILRNVVDQEVYLEDIEDVFGPYRKVIMEEYAPSTQTDPTSGQKERSTSSSGSDSKSIKIRRDRENQIRTTVFDLRNADVKHAELLVKGLKLNEEEKMSFIQRLDEEATLRELVSEEMLQHVAKQLNITKDKWRYQMPPKFEGTIDQIFDQFEKRTQ